MPDPTRPAAKIADKTTTPQLAQCGVTLTQVIRLPEVIEFQGDKRVRKKLFEGAQPWGVQMQSEIKVGQRFKFNILSDNPAPERQAVVTRVLSDSEEGLGPEVGFYFAYWVEAYELPETGVPTTLEFQRGTDGNVYLDGRQVRITLLT